jgi:hypothetical protein
VSLFRRIRRMPAARLIQETHFYGTTNRVAGLTVAAAPRHR